MVAAKLQHFQVDIKQLKHEESSSPYWLNDLQELLADSR